MHRKVPPAYQGWRPFARSYRHLTAYWLNKLPVKKDESIWFDLLDGIHSLEYSDFTSSERWFLCLRGEKMHCRSAYPGAVIGLRRRNVAISGASLAGPVASRGAW